MEKETIEIVFYFIWIILGFLLCFSWPSLINWKKRGTKKNKIIYCPDCKGKLVYSRIFGWICPNAYSRHTK